jgi:hypothetical protein
MHACICCICTFILCKYSYICTRTNTQYIYIYIYIYVCMYAYVYVYVYACICRYMSSKQRNLCQRPMYGIEIKAQLQRMYMHIQTWMQAICQVRQTKLGHLYYAYIHTYVCFVHKETQYVYIYIYIYIYIYAYVYVYVCVCICRYMSSKQRKLGRRPMAQK